MGIFLGILLNFLEWTFLRITLGKYMYINHSLNPNLGRHFRGVRFDVGVGVGGGVKKLLVGIMLETSNLVRK